MELIGLNNRSVRKLYRYVGGLMLKTISCLDI